MAGLTREGKWAAPQEDRSWSVAHNLVVLIAEMYTTGIEAIIPSVADSRREPAAPAILRFPTRV